MHSGYDRKMDVLADVLSRAGMRGGVFALSRISGDWGVELEGGSAIGIHAVTAGEAWVELDGHDPVRLLQGDVALVRSDASHRVVHAPGAPTQMIPVSYDDHPPVVVNRCGPQDRDATELLCGAYVFPGRTSDGVLAAVPPLASVSGLRGDAPALGAALEILRAEILHDGPGRRLVLDRLLDMLLVYALRSLFERPGAAAPPWYRALADPEIGRAVRAIHEAPAAPWTVASLAAEAGLSRAAFSRRFTALVGRAPMAYVTWWRMTLARDALLRPGAGLAAVAQEVGYSTEFAFAAAFRREVGVAPGRWRDAALAHRAADLTGSRSAAT